MVCLKYAAYFSLYHNSNFPLIKYALCYSNMLKCVPRFSALQTSLRAYLYIIIQHSRCIFTQYAVVYSTYALPNGDVFFSGAIFFGVTY